jgi:hypothetical protein
MDPSLPPLSRAVTVTPPAYFPMFHFSRLAVTVLLTQMLVNHVISASSGKRQAQW